MTQTYQKSQGFLGRMSKHRPNHSVTRRKGLGHRRRPRRYFAEAVSVVIFCILILVGIAGFPFVPREHGADEKAKTAGTHETTGQIVMVGVNDRCRQTNFNNLTGQLSDGQAIPCPAPKDLSKYEYPTNRLEGIAKGFFKGQR